MQDYLFYGGFAIAFIGIIARLILSVRSSAEMKKFADMPVKLQELRARNLTRRYWCRGVQLAGIIIAIVGLLAL